MLLTLSSNSFLWQILVKTENFHMNYQNVIVFLLCVVNFENRQHGTFQFINVGSRDRLFGLVVSTSDCHPRDPGFDSRLYSWKFSGSRPIGSETGSTQSREDNWVATWLRSSEIRLRKLKLRLRDKRFARESQIMNRNTTQIHNGGPPWICGQSHRQRQHRKERTANPRLRIKIPDSLPGIEPGLQGYYR